MRSTTLSWRAAVSALVRRGRSKEISRCREQATKKRRGDAMRPRTSFVLFVFLLSLIGAGTISASANTLRTGTILHVRTLQPIFADRDHPGTSIRAVVDRPVRSGRTVIIPSGARATVEVVDRSTNRRRVGLGVRAVRFEGRHEHH